MACRPIPTPDLEHRILHWQIANPVSGPRRWDGPGGACSQCAESRERSSRHALDGLDQPGAGGRRQERREHREATECTASRARRRRRARWPAPRQRPLARLQAAIRGSKRIDNIGEKAGPASTSSPARTWRLIRGCRRCSRTRGSQHSAGQGGLPEHLAPQLAASTALRNLRQGAAQDRAGQRVARNAWTSGHDRRPAAAQQQPG